MNSVIWIVVCLLISVGVVQCISWIVGVCRRPKRLRKGYHLIPLYENPDTLEAQLRYSLGQIQWSGGGGELVLLVDMGLGNESLKLCETMMRQNTGLFYCKKEDLSDTVHSLDQLQQVLE